jgi:hypothetical protein
MQSIKPTLFYAWEIYRKSFSDVWESFGMWGKIIDGFIIIASLCIKAFWDERGDVLIGEWDIWTILFTVALLVIPGLAIFNSVKVAAFRDKKQRDKLSLKEYDDIDITYCEYPWTDHQLNIGAGDFINFLKVGLLVRNNGGIKVHCGLRMISVQYNGYASNNDWVPNPNVIEQKLLKWDEGYEISDGKIEIYPNGGLGRILLAESNPYNTEFWFWFVDGKSNNHQLLQGE